MSSWRSYGDHEVDVRRLWDLLSQAIDLRRSADLESESLNPRIRDIETLRMPGYLLRHGKIVQERLPLMLEEHNTRYQWNIVQYPALLSQSSILVKLVVDGKKTGYLNLVAFLLQHTVLV